MSIIPANPETIAKAGRYLFQGGLVAFPTETVYGLGADATNGLAVAGIFSAKQRPAFNPLIVHVPDLEAAREFAVVTALAETLAAAFWPGPLTLVLARHEDCPLADIATAGLPSVAIRCPAHPVAQALLRAAKVPVAAPSANRSGHVSPTTAAHVLADLAGEVPMILDGGAAPVGLESTIVDARGAAALLLRPGAVTRDDLERVLGGAIGDGAAGDAAPSAPGQLASHYATRAQIRLDATTVAAGEALLAFGPVLPAGADVAVACVNLSADGNLAEAAANLFAALRTLDTSGAGTIAVQAIPRSGLGEAINDRLARAAAPRG